MREALFRAKGKDDGKWVYGWYCRYPFGKWPLKDAIIPSEEAESGYHRFVEVDPSTVGQYTGLLDKNGKRIFEGDILTNPDYPKYTTGAIYYGRTNCSCCDGVYGFYSEENADLRNADELTVIGNIHDNPELLEVKE